LSPAFYYEFSFGCVALLYGWIFYGAFTEAEGSEVMEERQSGYYTRVVIKQLSSASF